MFELVEGVWRKKGGLGWGNYVPITETAIAATILSETWRNLGQNNDRLSLFPLQAIKKKNRLITNLLPTEINIPAAFRQTAQPAPDKLFVVGGPQLDRVATAPNFLIVPALCGKPTSALAAMTERHVLANRAWLEHKPTEGRVVYVPPGHTLIINEPRPTALA